jgi:uncharacterized membrane protein
VAITCDSGTIDVIDATYGRRHGPEVCDHPATSNQECHADESVSIVSDACQGETSCEVQATNGVFGDPCGGTFKYLTVNYKCSGGDSAGGMSPIWASTHPADDFTEYTGAFEAVTDTHTLRLENDSPGGDKSVFVDAIRVNAQVEGSDGDGDGDATDGFGVANGDFEADDTGVAYVYATPTSWDGGGVICKNGNGPWGGLDSGSGAYYMSIQGAGNFLAQTLSGLVPGTMYEVTFVGAHRPGYGEDEALKVSFDDQTIWETGHPGDDFTAYAAAFTAGSDSGVLQFLNDSPPNDRSVFIDNVVLQEVTLGDPIDVANGDFEEDGLPDDYKYQNPIGWPDSTGGIVQCKNGNGPWGGLDSGSGGYFISVQGAGAKLTQTLSGLMVGGTYGVSFMAAHRPGYGDDETLRLIVDGTDAWSTSHPADDFTPYTGIFTAAATEAVLTFENDSPAGDKSVFVDAVTVVRLTNVVKAPAPGVLVNGDFEQTDQTEDYKYTMPYGWNGDGGIVICKNGNAPWGGLDSGSGGYFVSVQGAGAYIEQKVCGLSEDGASYKFSFLAAHRPGYGDDEALAVTVNTDIVWETGHPGDDFTKYDVIFTSSNVRTSDPSHPHPAGCAMIRIENDSPGGDKSVFVDQVQIGEIVPAGTVTVANADFEEDALDDGYKYQNPIGWPDSTGGIVQVQNSNGPWGGLDSGSGGYFVSIQGAGAALQQTVGGLTVGNWYMLSWLCADRPGYGDDELMKLFADGTEIWESTHPFVHANGLWSAYSAAFMATSTEAVIRWENDSPDGDKSVFIDKVIMVGIDAPGGIGVAINNGDFEMDAIEGYVYVLPKMWSGGGGTVIVENGNGPWGGLSSGSGEYFMSIQGNGAFLEQEVSGLTAGADYSVTFMAANRPGMGDDETLVLMVDGTEVWATSHPPDEFTSFTGVFTAAGETATIRLENDSPAGDKSVFVDAVVLAEAASGGAVDVLNYDFEADDNVDGFDYREPQDWNGEGGTVVVKSPPSAPNGPWGAGDQTAQGAPSGAYFVSIQGAGSYLEQTLSGLTAGAAYTVKFYCTHRRDAEGLNWGGAAEELQVLVDGVEIWESAHPPDEFEDQTVMFTATSDTATIRLLNNSPDGDNSVFVDYIRVNGVVKAGASIPVSNPSFEADTNVDGFDYRLPQDWDGEGGTVVVKSPPSAPNGPWGAGDQTAQGAPEGSYFVSIQGAGANLKQTLRVTAGSSYTVKFYCTHRRDAEGLNWGGSAEELQVMIDGVEVWESSHPPDEFQEQIAQFTATGSTAELQFLNSSPDGDNSVFVDFVRVNAIDGGVAIEFANGDFEADTIDGYVYVLPTDWDGGGGTVIVQNGNGPWGGLDSGSGGYFMSVQSSGAFLQQEVPGLTAGGTYAISFLTAKRPNDAGDDETLKVLVDGAVIWEGVSPPDAFEETTAVFKASGASAVIRVENDSPAGDKSIFVDRFKMKTVEVGADVPVANSGFDEDEVDGYVYVLPAGWGGDGGTVIVNNGNGPWGGLSSGKGTNFMSIQGSGAFLEQELSGLTAGTVYNVKFWGAHRPGYGDDETLVVKIDGTSIWATTHPGDDFTLYSAAFRASGDVGTVRFENDSPGGDKSVFIDAVSVTAMTVPRTGLENGDFEADAIDGYVYVLPSSWDGGGGTVIVQNGNGPWGGLDSGAGGFFMSIQNAGAYLEQSVSGLTPGAAYTLAFLAANRPGSGDDESLVVKVDGDVVWGGETHPADTFTGYTASFTAAGDTVVIRFENDSPAGDRSVFVDGVTIVNDLGR